MKITIDTKEDSHAEIRKVISMLQALVGGEETTYSNRDIFSDSGDSGPEVTPSATPSEPSGGVFGNMFDSDKSDLVEENKDVEEKKEEPDDDVEVIPY